MCDLCAILACHPKRSTITLRKGSKLRRVFLATNNDGDDRDQPRIPPPPATPLDFPSCSPTAYESGQSGQVSDHLKLFSNILRTGPSHKHLEALNVDLESEVPLEQLFPAIYLPSREWRHDPAKLEDANATPTTTPPNETLSNGGPQPGHEAFYGRARELLQDNDDAFRAARQKRPRPGHTAARVVHFRKFFDNLFNMADYWDTSQDNYSKFSSHEEVEASAQAAMETDEPETKAQMPDPPSSPSSGTPPDPWSKVYEKLSLPPPSDPVAEETYTGRRIDTGRNMPAKYREDTVFNFVEPLTWCFRCRIEHARQQPRLKMSGMIMPLPHNANIYRSPRDSRQARRGVLEGPLAGVYCRDTIMFRRPEDALGEGKQEVMDLLREVGLGLMLAQKRARDGKEEDGVQEDQWWAHKPRWGGGQGGEVGVEEEETVEELATGDSGGGQPKKKSRKMNRAALWREVRPPTTMWEKGVKYLRIGKEQGPQYDDVSNPVHSNNGSSRANHIPSPDLPLLLGHAPHLHHPPSRPHPIH